MRSSAPKHLRSRGCRATGVRRAGPASGTPPPAIHHYRLAFEHNLIGWYRTTVAGRILDCNESMARMLGYGSRSRLLRLRAVRLYHSPADRAAFLRDLLAQGTLTNFELALRRRDGASIHVLENVSLIRDARGRAQIIQGTMVDITERKQMEEALRASEARHRALAGELRRLARHVEAAREGERARIARELHDELGQALTVLNMDLHWLSARPASNTAAVKERVESMRTLVNRTMQTLRRICTDLRPNVLDDLGLGAAIEWQVREFQARTGVACAARLPAALPPVTRDQSTAVFRILQESLTNIARHAQATAAEVTLAVRGGLLTLRVRDNGRGIAADQASAPHALGLLGMRERALHWGGTLSIGRCRGRGTQVVLRMPLSPPSEEGPG